MRNKFLGTGEPGYHPLHKLAVVMSGLRYAVLNDFSVLYKAALSLLVLGLALWLHAWVDAAIILLATGVAILAWWIVLAANLLDLWPHLAPPAAR